MTSIKLVDLVKNGIKKFVKIINLEEIHWLLGIELKRDHEAGKLMLSQQSYINTLLYSFGFENIKPVSTPMNPTIYLTSDQSSKSTVEITHMLTFYIKKQIAS